jgi:hypothetical protein
MARSLIEYGMKGVVSMKTHRTTSCKESEDYFVQFKEDGKVVAEFGTTKEAAFRYNRLREAWRAGLPLAELHEKLKKITG